MPHPQILPRHTGEGREGESRSGDVSEDHDLKSSIARLRLSPLATLPRMTGEEMRRRAFESYCGPTTPAAFSSPISLAEKPRWLSTSSVCWPRLAAGPLMLSLVREKRGAAAGCGKPETST